MDAHRGDAAAVEGPKARAVAFRLVLTRERPHRGRQVGSGRNGEGYSGWLATEENGFA